MELYNVPEILWKVCCGNKSHLCDSAFNMLFSCQMGLHQLENSLSVFIMRVNGEESEIFNSDTRYVLSYQCICSIPGVFKTGEFFVFDATPRGFF
jgi:hypothetical protein